MPTPDQNAHLDEATIGAFADGRLGAHAAGVAALHIDACPACAGRVAAVDPSTALFVGCPEPVAPPNLAADALAAARAAEAHRPDPRRVALGVLFLLIAAALGADAGGNISWLARSSAWLSAASVLGAALLQLLPPLALAGLTTLATLALAIGARHVARPGPPRRL